MLESLLLSRDTHAIRVLQSNLEKLAITVEVCSGTDAGRNILSTERFDAVILDCDDMVGGLDLLAQLRKWPSNKGAIAFALLSGNTTTQKAFALGANFVLQKPVSPANAMHCFNAALSSMERERRRYFRLPVEVPVTLSFREGQKLRASSTNLSEGGMAIQFTGEFPQGAGLGKVAFALPGSDALIEPASELAWVDGKGHAGIRFREIPKDSRQLLDTWLASEAKKNGIFVS